MGSVAVDEHFFFCWYDAFGSRIEGLRNGTESRGKEPGRKDSQKSQHLCCGSFCFPGHTHVLVTQQCPRIFPQSTKRLLISYRIWRGKKVRKEQTSVITTQTMGGKTCKSVRNHNSSSNNNNEKKTRYKDEQVQKQTHHAS